MANAGVGATHVQHALRQGGQRAGGHCFHLRSRGICCLGAEIVALFLLALEYKYLLCGEKRRAPSMARNAEHRPWTIGFPVVGCFVAVARDWFDVIDQRTLCCICA